MKQINGEGNKMRIVEHKHESGNKAKNEATTAKAAAER